MSAPKITTLLKQHYSIIFVAIPTAAAGVGAIAFMGYSLATKPDVIINKMRPIQPQDRVDMSKTQKLYRRENMHPRDELEAHLKIVGPYVTKSK